MSHAVHHVNLIIVECIGDPGPPGERGEPGLPGVDGVNGNGSIIVQFVTFDSLISGCIMAAHICMF